MRGIPNDESESNLEGLLFWRSLSNCRCYQNPEFGGSLCKESQENPDTCKLTRPYMSAYILALVNRTSQDRLMRDGVEAGWSLQNTTNQKHLQCGARNIPATCLGFRVFRGGCDNFVMQAMVELY